MTGHPVFISYARRTSRHSAEALHRELEQAGIDAFLDSRDIELLEEFPAEIAEALLAARVVVVFADETYFTRWYCLREFETALAPFRALVRQNAASEPKEKALCHIAIGLPNAGSSRHVTDHLPPSLRVTQWPRSSEAKRLVDVVRERLAQATLSLEADLLAILGKSEAEVAASRFREQAALPPPANLRGIRLFPTQAAPSLGEGFKGRADDLWRLHHELSIVAAGDAPRSVAIEGGGGFGKTRLAREYLHRFGSTWYQGGLFWLDANVSSEEFEQRLHKILCMLKTNTTPDLKAFRDSGRNVREELAAVLQQLPAEAGVLFVLDNVPEPAPGDSPKGLEYWCPGSGVVSLISTSRTIANLQGVNVQPLNLGVLPPEAAVDLLTYRNQRAALEEREWRAIAEWVGRLPLALELLQGAMRAGAISPHELLSLATENRGTTAELDRLMASLEGEVPAGALRGITEAFEKSFQLLPENARDTACVLACLASAPIPVDLLNAMGEGFSSGPVRAALVGRSFVIRPEVLGGPSGSPEIFGQMHKLLSDFIRAKSPNRRAELNRAADAILKVMKSDDCRDPLQWPLMNLCLPHADLLFERMIEGVENDDAERPARLGLRIGILQRAQGAAEKARAVENRAVEFASKHLGAEHPTTLTLINNLAETLGDQGDLKGAHQLHQKVLEVRTRILGRDHPVTLTSMSNLAETLRDQGDLTRARRLHQKVLDVRTRILGRDDPNTLSSMNNLALTLIGQNDLKGARNVQQKVLEASKRILGPDHPNTLKSMCNLAATLYQQGDLEGARQLEDKALDVRTRVLGRQHSDTTLSAWNLLLTLRAQGELDQANIIVEQDLKWILTCDSDSLSYQQRQVREQLQELLKRQK